MPNKRSYEKYLERKRIREARMNEPALSLYFGGILRPTEYDGIRLKRYEPDKTFDISTHANKGFNRERTQETQREIEMEVRKWQKNTNQYQR